MTPEEARAKDKASRQGKEAERELSSATEKVGKRSESAADAARETAREAGEAVKEKAEAARRYAERESEKLVGEGKARVGGELAAYRHAARRAAETLEEESATGASSILYEAADMLDKAQSHLDRRDMRGLLRDAENLVRSNPQVAFGGLFVLGLATARFLKASADEPRTTDSAYRAAVSRPVRPAPAARTTATPSTAKTSAHGTPTSFSAATGSSDISGASWPEDREAKE